MRSNSGQALLIMVLVMAVALTIGLAVISQSITDIKISHQEEESSRAFSAAEAGIEQALKLGPGDYPITSDITARVTETAQGGGDQFVFPTQISQGETQSIWFVQHDESGGLIETPYYTADSFKVCWEDTDPETAIEAIVFYKDGGVYKVARGAYDADAASRGNSFEVPNENCDNLGLGRGKTLTRTGLSIPNGAILVLLQLRPLYNQAKIGAAGTGGPGGILPGQGECYESTASVPGSGITRKVQQCQFYKAPPGVFDYALYSGGDLAK